MSNTLFNVLATLAVVGAGVSLALQQVLNAKLRGELASPWWAGVVSYAVGTLVMLTAVVVFAEPRPTTAIVARVPWSAWTGGVFGAIFVATAILTVPRLGAAAVLALAVVGQMLGALIFDQLGLSGLTSHPFTAVRLTGALLLVLGVVLVRA